MAIALQPTTKPTKTSRDQSALTAADNIKSVKEVERHLKMCLYGRNKVGKTMFACSSNLKTLIIDCNEHGFDSVADKENVDIYQVSKWEDLDPIYWMLRNGKHEYEVIVIDTITMLASVGMKWVLKDDTERDMTKDPLTPDRRSYLKLGEMLKDAIIKFRNLPYHVIFTAQEKTSTDDDEEGNTLIETHPELSPAPRSVLLSATNIIGRIYVREAEKEVKGVTKKIMQRRMLLGSVPKYVSGNRFKQLRAVEVIPEDGALQGFIDRIYGGNTTHADTQ
jgi:phage nucleotide-binding protein